MNAHFPAPTPAPAYGLTVEDLTKEQVHAFVRHGVSLEALPEILTRFHMNSFYPKARLIEGVLPWCGLYGGITADGESHT